MHARVSVIACLWLALACVAANAQTWPAKPVTIVVGSQAGSGIDSIARFVAEGLRERTGRSFIVENRPGAVGNLAAQAVARAAPDGYTAFFGATSTHIFNPILFRNPGFDPVKDFQPVTTLLATGGVLLVNTQMPVKSVAELSAYLKANPGRFAYASGNQFGRVLAEWYKQIIGFDAVHVPYNSVPQAINDMLGGRIQFMFADTSFGMPMARAGKVRALAVTAPQRISGAPEMPTMMEAGVENFEEFGWIALFFPARTPMDITRRLAELCNAVMTTDKAREYLRGLGADPLPGSPESLLKSIIDERAKWEPIVRKAGIEPE